MAKKYIKSKDVPQRLKAYQEFFRINIERKASYIISETKKNKLEVIYEYEKDYLENCNTELFNKWFAQNRQAKSKALNELNHLGWQNGKQLCKLSMYCALQVLLIGKCRPSKKQNSLTKWSKMRARRDKKIILTAKLSLRRSPSASRINSQEQFEFCILERARKRFR